MATSFLLRIHTEGMQRKGHDRVQFFIGPDRDHRQLAGELLMARSETSDLLTATGATCMHPDTGGIDWEFTERGPRRGMPAPG